MVDWFDLVYFNSAQFTWYNIIIIIIIIILLLMQFYLQDEHLQY